MGIENLITIGVIIYVIYSIKKVISGGKKDGEKAGNQSKPKKGGWTEKLGDFINEIKEEIEKAGQVTPTQQTTGNQNDDDDYFWDEVRESVPPKHELPRQTVKFEQGNDFTRAADRDTMVLEIPPIPEESHRNFHGSHDKPSHVFDNNCQNKSRFKMRKSDLKTAVIWSEILSKPVGLRDEGSR